MERSALERMDTDFVDKTIKQFLKEEEDKAKDEIKSKYIDIDKKRDEILKKCEKFSKEIKLMKEEIKSRNERIAKMKAKNLENGNKIKKNKRRAT